MSVLQRKAQVGKQDHQARAMTVPKALRLGLAKVADDAFDMALAVIGVTKETAALTEILEDVGDETLLLLLDGVSGKGGGALLGSALVSALVQQQTTGRVATSVSDDRRMTATDAALCAPLIDLLFKRAHGLLESDADRVALPCLKFGARAENKRLFELALEEPAYTVLRLTVDIAGGVAQSSLVLLLPQPTGKLDDVVASGDNEAAKGPNTLQPAMMNVPAELTAVLCRLRFPLSQIGAFEIGQAIDIPTEAFDAVELLSIGGRLISSGAMGHVDGNRALMLTHGAGEHATTGRNASGLDDLVPEQSDYSKLDLPELDLSSPDVPFDPSNIDTLPEFPDLPETSVEELPDLPELDGLPDLPDLADFSENKPDLPDLPKLNIA